MASSSKSPSTNSSSDSDTEIYILPNEHLNVVVGLGDLAVGGEGDGSDSNGSGASENGVCVGKNNGFLWGVYEAQGGRQYMEDMMAVVPGFLRLKCDAFGGCTAPECRCAMVESPIYYFGVFDGHGGSEVSEYCAHSMDQAVKEAWECEGDTDIWTRKWESALSLAYRDVDHACINHFSSGSTAVVVLISPCQIVAANCGDSRAVLSRGSYTIPLTVDHKPSRLDEEERIIESGGFVVPDQYGVLRVDGVLAMTRAIGDRSLKPSVSAVPEFTFTTRTDEDECLVIASDGLWDVMSTEEVGSMASVLLQRTRGHKEDATGYVAKFLYQQACVRCSSDNFSVIVVDLKMQS
ncbi:protein phosphatase 2C 56-like [Bidens hawaiensis]|uniref:protein phosphatase 2C 56-like n=1 Tax=Bidens hawaiensis TaxID=980011 RepID=UPI00404A67F7